MLQYFSDESANDFPTFSSFACSIGATMADLKEWRKEQPRFALAWEECRERQKSALIRGALAKRYDATTVKYLLTELFGHGEEKTEQTFSVTVEVVE
jgi:hypothetical protein